MITVPDHNLIDTHADHIDYQELEREVTKMAAWDEMLSDDGDIGDVLELLMDYPDDVLPLLRAVHRGEDIQAAAVQLGKRLHALADEVIEVAL